MFSNPYKRSDEKHVYVSNNPPDFFEIEVCHFPQDLRTRELSVDVTAEPSEDEDGYGPAQVLAAHTDTGYWFEVMLTYNWASGWKEDPNGKRYYLHYRGHSVQFHVWSSSGETHWYDETHLLGGERVEIRDGERINLAMQIQGDEVVLGVYGRKKYEIRYPSYRSKFFVGTSVKRMEDGNVALHERGYFTGIALERYHTRYTWGGKKDHQYAFKLLVPDEIRISSFEVHARNDATKQTMFTKIVPLIPLNPSFNEQVDIAVFHGSPREINIRVLGQLFREALRAEF